MDKVIGVVASPRKLGNSHVLVQLCLDAVKSCGVATELVYLHDLNIKNCRGCLACVYKGECSIVGDDMPELLDVFLKAKGLIVAAPTYIFSPTSIIKNVIDRSMMLTPYLDMLKGQDRYAVVISIAGNPAWNHLGLTQVSQFALAFGYQICRRMEAFAPGPAEVLLQDQILAEVEDMGKDLVSALQTGKSPSSTRSAVSCPLCMGDVFRLNEKGKAICVACGAAGYINSHEDGLRLEDFSGESNFFTPASRQEHINEWIIPSKDRFLSRREKIKAELIRLGFKK
ncbi:MAG: flavodoxin family protein [Bacillota bacterium]